MKIDPDRPLDAYRDPKFVDGHDGNGRYRPWRPLAKRKRCAHCQRMRLSRLIEWHPGIWEWQCSDFYDCDKARGAR